VAASLEGMADSVGASDWNPGPVTASGGAAVPANAGGNPAAVAASMARVHTSVRAAVLITAPQAVHRPLETVARPPQLGQFIEE
jgi:hypothetical protein